MAARTRYTSDSTLMFIVVWKCFALAASSGPVRFWTSTTSDPTPVRGSDGIAVTLPPFGPAAAEEPVEQEDMTLLYILGVLGGVLLVIACVYAAKGAKGWSWLARVRYRRGSSLADALPEVAGVPAVEVDMVAARAALASGTPRNAIVACWMQLERDATDAGVARDPAETSSEYAARVIAEASVDTAPIHELAALFREARFSRHELGPAHRDAALDALERVEAALGARRREVPA